MRRILTAALAFALSVPTLSVAAQEIGTVDVGLFGRYSIIDKSLSEDPAMSVGGRFAMFMFRNVALELEHAAGNTTGDPKTGMAPFYLRLALHNAHNDRWSSIIGAGWVRDRTRVQPSDEVFDDDGYTGLIGLQRKLGERASIRFDVIGDYLPSPVLEGPGNDLTNVNLHLQVGLNWRWNVAPPVPDGDGDGVPDASDACRNTPAATYVDGRGCTPPRDSDNDGVMDPADRCANSPAGVPVTADGCPRDSDGDGVTDNLDQCANTPSGVPVTANGCPRDSDGDGVSDDVDRCPNTPTGTRVTATGCPIDSDGDGVIDAADACANTPTGTRVDARGCPMLFEEGRTSLVLEGVNFASGRAVLTPESHSILDRVAESLVQLTDVRVEVQGHTDATGSAATNTRLSQARADAVRNYLISQGVPASRLTARGFGPAQPVASNTTADGRAQNRRVELHRTP